MTGRFVTTVLTPPAAGTFTDANMAAIGTTRNDTTLFLVTPDPVNCVVQGCCGTPNAGIFNAAANTFVWPNGIVYTDAAGSQNAFGPGTGYTNQDFMIHGANPYMTRYSASRLVAGGFKLQGTSSYSSVSGIVHMAPIYVDMSLNSNDSQAVAGGGFVNYTTGLLRNGWQVQLPSNASDLAALPGYVQFPLSELQENTIVGLFKRVDSSAKLFKPTANAWMLEGSSGASTRVGAATSPDGYGHYCIVVFVEGFMPNGTTNNGVPVMGLDIIYHLETQIKGSSTYRVTSGLVVNNNTGSDVARACPHQPLLMAAADTMCGDIPAIRASDPGGIQETSFVSEVSRLWGTALRIASGVSTVFDVVGPALAALVI